MKLSKLILALVAILLSAAPAWADSFRAGDGSFLLNDEPVVIKAAELHYPRIPRPYWDQRIKQVKALGMNAVCLYVFWNVHEPQEGVFDFEGQNDLAEFIRLCQANDLKVILRPGPYVCAEWEMGGMPWWLLKNKDVRLRENDPYFLDRVAAFEHAVAQQVAPLTIQNGGPVIMIQVENEYGSYGESKEYVAAIRDMLRKEYGPEIAMFQCDWSSNFTLNGLDDLTWTMNFGTGANIDEQFRPLQQLRPDSPLMCSEFWSGWFDKWGANHETRPAEDMIDGIDQMLQRGISFSLYMTHGGTNWGHWAGANSPGFAPDVTSYDYDAPISESGQYTPKYDLLRSTLQKYSTSKLPKAPAAIKPIAIPEFEMSQVAPLWQNLPSSLHSKDIKTMEEYDQGFGSMVYSTTLPALSSPSVLTVREPHDFAQIFIDGKKIGSLDRRNGEVSLQLPPTSHGARLDILVEAMGRINFGRAVKDFKGITNDVTLSTQIDGHTFSHTLQGWDVALLPDTPEFYDSMSRDLRPLSSFNLTDSTTLPAGLYRGSFNIKGKPSDTFLDFSSWGKGLVYVNGHPLGRIWNIGPQQTLYMPGCWLRQGQNDIVVFDILGPQKAVVQGLKAPLLDNLAVAKPLLHRSDGQQLDLAGLSPVLEASFAPGNGWQKIQLPQPVTGRYVCLEALSSQSGEPQAAIAELYLLDADGNRLSREPWTVSYADSENIKRQNRSADKLFDLQESTFWQTVKSDPYPHAVVIDLGAPHTISAIEQLPRMEAGAPNAIKQFRLFVSDSPFKF